MLDRFDLDNDVLARYLAGESSVEDRQLLEQRISENPARLGWLVELEAGVASNDIPHFDVQATWSRIAERTGVVTDEREFDDAPRGIGTPRGQMPGIVPERITPDPFRIPPSKIRRSLWSLAASLALAAITLIIGWQWSERRITQKLSREASVYTTQNGQRSSVVLPDGTRVLLSVASRLEVASDFSTGNRTVRLRGEALFTVAHHQGNPFTVVAGSSVTRVLGTEFLVQAYGNGTPAIVAVRDGKVAVGSQVLTAMQQISVTETGETSVAQANVTQFAFAKGVLSLTDKTLQDAVPILNRWYDIDIQLGDPSLANRRITVELTTGTFSDLIEVFEYSFNMRVVRSGRVLTLYP